MTDPHNPTPTERAHAAALARYDLRTFFSLAKPQIAAMIAALDKEAEDCGVDFDRASFAAGVIDQITESIEPYSREDVDRDVFWQRAREDSADLKQWRVATFGKMACEIDAERRAAGRIDLAGMVKDIYGVKS